MKKNLIYLLTFLLLGFLPALTVFAQAPDKFYFQAEARDSKGKPIEKATDLSVKITILAGSPSGTVVWEGYHYGVHTDDYGLFTLVIGEGTDGSHNFWAIDWANNSHYLNVQVEDNGTWVDMGTTQFLSVPYAKHATMADSAINETDPIHFQHFRILSPVDNQLLRYNSAISKFENVDASAGSEAWNLTGNTGTDPVVNFLGTTDDNPIVFRVNNNERMRLNSNGNLAFVGTGESVFIGEGAGENDDLSENRNVFIGFDAGNSNISGYDNTATGHRALYSNNGNGNTAYGSYALHSNESGDTNTAFGHTALYNNVNGFGNTAVGVGTLGANTNGNLNTASGYSALVSNRTGNYNTAMGVDALWSNTDGLFNTACGCEALRSNNGWSNTAMGMQALRSNMSGTSNTATGFLALYSNITGSFNTATGDSALFSNRGSKNTAIGTYALLSNETGNNNTAVGYGAGPGFRHSNLNNTGAFGYGAEPTASNTYVFGNENVVGWGFGVSPVGYAIKVGNDPTNGNGATLTLGGVWTSTSDISKKYDIEEINYGLNDVMELHPVSYKMKGSNIQDIGFIAQEVKEILPEIVYGEEGQMTMSYGQVTSVLVKAIQEQQQMIEELKARINVLEND